MGGNSLVELGADGDESTLGALAGVGGVAADGAGCLLRALSPRVATRAGLRLPPEGAAVPINQSREVHPATSLKRMTPWTPVDGGLTGGFLADAGDAPLLPPTADPCHSSKGPRHRWVAGRSARSSSACQRWWSKSHNAKLGP